MDLADRTQVSRPSGTDGPVRPRTDRLLDATNADRRTVLTSMDPNLNPDPDGSGAPPPPRAGNPAPTQVIGNSTRTLVDSGLAPTSLIGDSAVGDRVLGLRPRWHRHLRLSARHRDDVHDQERQHDQVDRNVHRVQL